MRYRIVPERSRLFALARSSLHPIRVETGAVGGFIEAQIAGEVLDLNSPPRAVKSRLRPGP